MPLPKGYESLQVTLDSQLLDIFNQASSKMDVFLSQKGWYFQGVDTCTVPVDGTEKDQIATESPTYCTDTWQTFGIILPSKTSMDIAIYNYNGPDGKDWALRGSLILNGELWMKILSGNNRCVKDKDWTNLGKIG